MVLFTAPIIVNIEYIQKHSEVLKTSTSLLPALASRNVKIWRKLLNFEHDISWENLYANLKCLTCLKNFKKSLSPVVLKLLKQQLPLY